MIANPNATKNVFSLFFANERKLGFWIRRWTWTNTCAQVVAIANFKGPPPYYGNPAVTADIYDLTTGELRERVERLTCAGSYQWEMISAPVWASSKSPEGSSASQ
jgi:hypothetical protein